jgi:Zn finger protein HypA/HybF involved in hydrogenase expression
MVSLTTHAIKVIKCGSCNEKSTQKSDEFGAFEEMRVCPKCGSTNIGTIRIVQSDK